MGEGHMSVVFQPILEKGIVDHLWSTLQSLADKERKRIIKGMKGHVSKIAQDRFGSMIIMRELQTVLKELILDKNGRRPLLQLLHPNCTRYLSPDDLALLDSSIPSLLTKGGSEPKTEIKSSEDEGDEDMSNVEENVKSVVGGKKDPILRRRELLVDSVLAEVCLVWCNCMETLKYKIPRWQVAFSVEKDSFAPRVRGTCLT